MKEPLSNYTNNIRPFLYPSGPTARQRAYQLYRQKRRRERRIFLLTVCSLLIMALAGLAIAGAWKFKYNVKPLLSFSSSSDTKEFQAFMDREFGTADQPSLLYYNTLDFALLSKGNGVLKNKLLPILPNHEDSQLKNEVQSLMASYGPRFKSHLYFYNPQDASYIEINGYDPVPAASIIKLPILLDYLLSLDENMIQMNSPLLYAEFHKAGGSGELQYKPSGQIIPANLVAGEMIRISDNTCSNMMISYLGGSDAVNKRLSNLGLVKTRIRNWLPDLQGTNTISTYEMATILYNVDHGPLISDLSRYNGIGILESTHNRRLLVEPLPPEVRVAHKTGDIGTALGDSGAVYLPDGRKYFISVQVERPYNDYGAKEMIQKISRLVYDHVEGQQVARTQDSTLKAQI